MSNKILPLWPVIKYYYTAMIPKIIDRLFTIGAKFTAYWHTSRHTDNKNDYWSHTDNNTDMNTDINKYM